MPACSALTFAVVLHPSKLRCSARPLLDCVQLTALRPRGSPAQWPSTKAPGASSTSTTKFPQPRETAVANPILLQNTYLHTNTHTRVHRQKQADTLMFVSAWLSASYCTFGRKTLLCICETGSQYEELEFHKQMLHFFPSLFLLGCCVLREREVKEHAGLRYIYPVQKWRNVTVKRWKPASETAFSCLAFFPTAWHRDLRVLEILACSIW